MPIDIESLVQPLSAEAPSGSDLRYEPVTDQIKEARRQEDNLAQGVWEREAKVADYPLVIKLSKDVLSKRSKDLQIAGWLAEALLRQEGYGGLRQGLELIYRLLDTFWNSVYPQADDDGDLELRATPLRWVGSQLDSAVRSVALTRAGHNWYQYKESRTVPTEEDSDADSGKQERRADAIADGKLTPEEFDKGFEATPVGAFEKLHSDLAELVEFVRMVGGFCDEKFGDASPDLGPLRSSLEDVYQTTRILLKQRGGPAAAAAPADGEAAADGVAEEEAPPDQAGHEEAPAVRRPVRKRATAGIDPADFEDAVERLQAIARFIRRENPQNPAAYLILRGLRWGEVRATAGYAPDLQTLEPPSTEIRMELKRLVNEGNWEQVLEAAENAAGMPCGRCWLDLQRYAVNACRFTGNDAAANAIVSELKALLTDFPELPNWVLADDTAAANAETQQWLKDESLLAAPIVEAAPPPPPPVEWYPPPQPERRAEHDSGQPAPPDAYELAMQAAQSGNVEEAIGILSREVAQERSGRDRFLRKTQLAQVCLASGNPDIARPVLQELADEIERRNLEQWEVADVVAQPLALLYRCLDSSEEEAAGKRKLYSRICRLDPARALGLVR